MTVRVLTGDCRDVLATLPDQSVHCIVTSPPYFGLRAYLPDGHPDKAKEVGTEATPDAFVAELVAVFRECRRILRDDGVAWLNLGDSFCSGSQTPVYSLRDDCSAEVLNDVALEMFGMRIDGDFQESQRALPEVLSTGVQGSSICAKPDVAGGRVEEELRSTSGESHSTDAGTEEGAAEEGGSGVRRSVRVLRGGDAAVSDDRPCSRGRSGPPEGTSLREQPSIVLQSAPGHSSARLPERQVQNPLLELQLRNRRVGLLSARQFTRDEIPERLRKHFKPSGLKPKDLIGIPWLVAFALRADGWYLRSDIIWSKPNPMPESVRDRPTKAHEYIFLLTKSARYFFDQEAVREPLGEWSQNALESNWTRRSDIKHQDGTGSDGSGWKAGQSYGDKINPAGRNIRSVWTVATQPYADAHFATFPPDLIEPCIKAGTSEKGCCAKCGAPWVRVVEKGEPDLAHQRACGGDVNGEYAGTAIKDYAAAGAQNASEVKARILAGMREKITTGWSRGCLCAGYENPVPCTVLDCFGGAGTTGLVADRLQRNAILIELNPSYAEMARSRLTKDAGLFAEVA